MRIREFTIDRFGTLHSQHVAALPPGMTVFLGENEAGKSTCLNFFRAMLFGYARNRKSIDYLTDARAVAGGSLLIESEALGTVRLARRPGKHGGPVTLTGPDGSPRPDADLSLLLRGCTPDLYDKVFAFSLGELMHFGSLTDDRIRHALHGAAFGMGLRSPGQVLKELEDAMRRIFAPRATSSKIHGLLRDLDAINATLKERGNEVDRYAALREELEAAARELETSRTARRAMEEERRVLERTLALRQRWDALCEAGDALAAFPETPGVFTPDGRERLDRLTERLDARQHAAAAALLALERAEAEDAAPGYDPDLAAASGDVLALWERKESARDAVGRIQSLALEKEGLERDVAGICADLGPGWTPERLAACDLSIASYEACGTLGRHLAATEQAVLHARNEAGRVERERGAAESAWREARDAFRDACGADDAAEVLPEDADATAMERLAQLLTRAEDAHGNTGALARAALQAEQALRQALEAVDPAWTPEDLGRAALAPVERERLLGVARSVAAAEAACGESEREARAARLVHDDIAVRVAALETSVASVLGGMPGLPDEPGGASVAGAAMLLDARRRVLRRAQAARRNLDAAQAAYGTANEQLGDIASLVRGTRRTPPPWGTLVLFLCALLLVCGAGALYIGLSRGEGRMTLWGAGGLAAGLAFGASWLALAAGSGTEAVFAAMERNWAAIEQRLVRTRVAAQNARLEAEDALEALAGEAPDLFPGGVADGEALAEAEQTLARQREQLAVLEREAKELEREKTALAGARARLDRADSALEAARRTVEEARAAWENALASRHLPETTPPEEARSLCERLDAAVLRHSHAQGRLAEQAAAQAVLDECLRFARSLPGLADMLASLPEPGSHLAPEHGPWLELARDYLARQRGAGRERIRLRELLGVRAARLEELTALGERADAGLEEAETARATARAAWEAWLAGMEFATSLSPETAVQAMDAASRARAALAAAKRLDAARESIARDTAAFADGVAALADLLPEHPEGGQPALLAACRGSGGQAQSALAGTLALLGDLLQQSRNAGEKAAVAEAGRRELPALRDAVRLAAEQADATREELEAMLRLARCDSPESYRGAHAVWEQREAALAARNTLRAALEREAAEAGLPFAELAASLAATDREENAARLQAQEEKLGEVLAREHALAEKKGGLDAAMAGLLNEKGLTALLAGREGVLAEMEDMVREWSRLAVARELLLAAKGRFESERQTGVVRSAGDFFSAVTGGAYSGITVSLEDESVAAVARDGALKNPETELSRGTREQLYLALRLAYVRDHGAQAERLPVIMDDILVNFDARRARSAASVLAAFAEEHQVLFFTCHKETAAMLEEAAPGAARYTLDKGVFVPCNI